VARMYDTLFFYVTMNSRWMGAVENTRGLVLLSNQRRNLVD